ncbi:hypothetical protein [Streptomyces laculatispora]|uniref:hypothetical protein n=1 Tax=Streptomyces laculatispora TaxID=887464 RepID=UPI001F5E6F1D|nr:hypothetical protein [Streptomyces laculatispora]
MIDLGKIPTFTGSLETLETHAASLKTTASNIRGTGKDVHTAFQALDAVYDAPEQEELLNSTIPVRDKADEFAKKLESVSGALTGFASTARPLVNRMNQLRADAAKFVADNKDDDDWQQDQHKIDENSRLVHEVGTTWVAFQGAERDAANQITALVGGTHFVVDDGSHKAGMYGFKESDVKDSKETPWGTVDKREYTGLRAAWGWTKDNVGGALKGFFVDGVWGTIKGLGSMVNVFDWDDFKKTWSSIGDVFGGVSAYRRIRRATLPARRAILPARRRTRPTAPTPPVEVAARTTRRPRAATPRTTRPVAVRAAVRVRTRRRAAAGPTHRAVAAVVHTRPPGAAVTATPLVRVPTATRRSTRPAERRRRTGKPEHRTLRARRVRRPAIARTSRYRR